MDTISKQEILDAITEAWKDASEGHGNPFITLEFLLKSFGLKDQICTDDTGHLTLKTIKQI